jgi:ribosomal protein L29
MAEATQRATEDRNAVNNQITTAMKELVRQRRAADVDAAQQLAAERLELATLRSQLVAKQQQSGTAHDRSALQHIRRDIHRLLVDEYARKTAPSATMPSTYEAGITTATNTAPSSTTPAGPTPGTSATN